MKEKIKNNLKIVVDEAIKFKLELIAIVCILGAVIAITAVIDNTNKHMSELKQEMDVMYAELTAICTEYDILKEEYDLLGDELEAQLAINHTWSIDNTDIKQLIYSAATVYDVDPIMCIAIARLESGNFTSELFLSNYNLGGIKKANGDYVKYKNIYDGINSFVHLIATYKARGMDTPEKMQSTYCPPNKKWDEQIRAIMSEENEETYY